MESKSTSSGHTRSHASKGKPNAANHNSLFSHGLPASVVFLLVAPIGVMGIGGLFVFGKYFIPGTMLICGGILWVLYINDHRGFVRSKQMRRAHEPRRHFNAFEVLVLFGMVAANLLLMAYILIAR